MRQSIFDPHVQAESPEAKIAVGLIRVGQALSAMRNSFAGDAGLSGLQVQLLIDLAASARPRGISHLAGRHGLTAATISDSIRVLAEKGLVTKSTSVADGRAVNISLTREGRHVAAAASEWAQMLVDVVSSWDENRRGEVLAALVSLIGAMQREGWIQTDRMCTVCRFFERDRYPGTSSPHHCRFIDAPLRLVDLRIDCPDFEAVVNEVV